MEKSRTIAKAKVVAEVLSKFHPEVLTTEALHANFLDMVKMLKNLAEVAENYENLTFVQADLIASYKKRLELSNPKGWDVVQI